MIRRWLGLPQCDSVKVVVKPYIFVITSTIRFSEKPLSYTRIRSVFSDKERLEQTLRSIKSIRARVPDALIVLLENSNLSTEEASILQNAADWFVLLSRDAKAIKLRDSLYKGAAETYMLQWIQNVLKCFDYHIMFKLSGRYWLSERFDIRNFPSDRFGVLARNNVYSTRLYSVPKELDALYCRQMEKTMQAALQGAGIESVFMKGVPQDKIKLMEHLGVRGYVSPTGDLVDE